MQTLHEVRYLRAAIRAEKQNGKRVALVPTMGNLHEGHMQLVRRAHEVADCVVVSIFVNPMQFGESKDLDNYPRTMEEDRAKLQAENTHYLFVPDNNEIYPNGTELHTKVNVDALDGFLEGASRQGHFEGVCTVVNKLFNLVQPSLSVFGEKDYQQLAIVRRMVEDLCMPVDIVGLPTVREANGLAMSSRNGHLSQAERNDAGVIYRELQAVRDRILAGERNFEALCAEAKNEISAAGLVPDYFDVRDASSLAVVDTPADDAKLVVLAAAYMGEIRLLDNISIALGDSSANNR
ncbi:MAG: pantoate--beta-alanine ligase [Gammaproteobacteria bacterium]|nr:pantoate--beta-alanine ligase [Gammaproteobacteria bacterium]NND38439.1 pantoate--beta-alanine ligase [Pseudomonadales bacterium]RZV58492.1 MAG: pantoate--beta-alanine ligase [Pseudomonadales bacterium]